MKKSPAQTKRGHARQPAPNPKKRVDGPFAHPMDPQGQPRVGHLSLPSKNETDQTGAGRRATDNIRQIPAPPES